MTTRRRASVPEFIGLIYTSKVIRDTLHEDFGRKQESQGSSDRAFAIVFAIFFALVSFSPLRTPHPVRWWAFPVAGLFLFVDSETGLAASL